MWTDFIIFIIGWADDMFTSFDFYQELDSLITTLNTYQTYINDFQYYLSGAYFIFGKPLIIFCLTVSGGIFIISLIGAIVNIVSQFIP